MWRTTQARGNPLGSLANLQQRRRESPLSLIPPNAPYHPFKIPTQTSRHRKGDDFWDVIWMKLLDPLLKLRVAFVSGFYQQQYLFPLFHRSFPAIHRTHIREDIAASRVAFFHKSVRKLLRELKVRCGDKHHQE